MARTPAPKEKIKIRRLPVKKGDERLIRAKVLAIREGDDPELVLEIHGLAGAYAPVRVKLSKTLKADGE